VNEDGSTFIQSKAMVDIDAIFFPIYIPIPAPSNSDTRLVSRTNDSTSLDRRPLFMALE